MNEMELSKRLKKVVEQIPQGAKIADIGSDHAYLPCYAYLNGLISGAVAGEVNEGPWQSAVQQVKRNGISEHIAVRKGNGLAVLESNEVDAIIIAGMGGQLIATILDEGEEKLEGVQRLILQPNVGARFVRRWLRDHGWELKEEHILEEDNKIYEILTAERGNPHAPYESNEEAGLLFGPYLLQEKSSTFIKKWTHELENWERIVKRMEDAAQQNEELFDRRKRIERKITLAQEVL